MELELNTTVSEHHNVHTVLSVRLSGPREYESGELRMWPKQNQDNTKLKKSCARYLILYEVECYVIRAVIKSENYYY